MSWESVVASLVMIIQRGNVTASVVALIDRDCLHMPQLCALMQPMVSDTLVDVRIHSKVSHYPSSISRSNTQLVNFFGQRLKSIGNFSVL